MNVSNCFELRGIPVHGKLVRRKAQFSVFQLHVARRLEQSRLQLLLHIVSGDFQFLRLADQILNDILLLGVVAQGEEKQHQAKPADTPHTNPDFHHIHNYLTGTKRSPSTIGLLLSTNVPLP